MDEEDLRWGLSSGSEYDSEDSNGTNQIHLVDLIDQLFTFYNEPHK